MKGNMNTRTRKNRKKVLKKAIRKKHSGTEKEETYKRGRLDVLQGPNSRSKMTKCYK